MLRNVFLSFFFAENRKAEKKKSSSIDFNYVEMKKKEKNNGEDKRKIGGREGGHNILYQIFIGNQEDKKNNGLNTIFILKK